MLKWLSGGDRVDHPMAETAHAKEIIAAFPAGDSIKTLQEGVYWLDSISAQEDFKPARRYELIELIDVALKRHAQKALEQYLSLKPPSKSQEGVLLKAGQGYWKSLGDAYLVCVTQFEADKAAADTFRKSLPVLVARAMRAQMLQIKWILMQYGYVSDSYWKTVGRLHNLAEAGGFLDEAVDIYSGAHGRGTVRQELLRTLMLGVSTTGGLTPIKQNIAERAIANFSDLFISGTQPAVGLNFVFDLNDGASPARALAAPPAAARLYYFGAGNSSEGAQKIIDGINATGALLSDINLGPGENIDQVADTLLHLACNWDQELPMRDSERRRVAAKLRIRQGMDGLMASGESAALETWIVENESEEGYGVIVPERSGAWLQVGALIGFLPEGENAAWGAGVVRRVESDAQGRRRAGVQVLSRAVVPATMCTLVTSGVRGQPKEVVLLSSEPSQSGYLLALLRHDTFALRDPIEATRSADGKTFVLTPSGLVEFGVDFERVRFKLAA